MDNSSVLHNTAPVQTTERFLSMLATATEPLIDATQVMQTTAKLLAEHLGVDRCAYASIEDQEIFVITGDHPRNGARSIVGRWPVAAFGAECVRQMLAGEAYVVDDSETDPRISEGDRLAYRATEIGAVICVPLHKAAKFTAAMAVHQKVARNWSAEEIALVRRVVARCWEALERARSEARYRGRLDYAVRLSGIGFWYCNLPFDELTWDERVKEHFFLPKDARVTIDLFYERIHPTDRDVTRAAIDASIANHSSYDVVYRTVNPQTNAIKWIRALGGTAYDVEGNPVHFDGVTVDVTTQHLAQERVAEQARLLSSVASAALQVHASSSQESVLRVVSEEARAMIGARRATVNYTPSGSGQTMEAVSLRPADASSPQDAADQSDAATLTVPFLGRDGAVRGSLTLEQKLRGRFTEIDQSVLIQLVQIGMVALENAELYDRLREQDRKKDEFLAVLAHELRNPLAPIRTGLDVLELTDEAAIVSRTRAMMQRQVVHLVRLVDDLLDVSRVTRGKVTLKKERLDLRAVFSSAIDTSRPALDAGQLELIVRVPSEPLWVDADPTRMAQVIANLLNNAAKYSPLGAPIVLEAAAEAAMVQIRLVDRGKGIPQEMLSRVFDMFTQVDGDSGLGLGIGLALARHLVAMHGGTLEVESAGIGQGAAFTIRLPRAEAAAETASLESFTPRGSALRVLVVDDNVDAAETLSSILELSGHSTRLVHTGSRAVPAAIDFRPDVVMLDIGLPELDGYQVARLLRNEPTVKHAAIIALTGWGSEEDRRQARSAGFDEHLVKPVDTAILAMVLANVRR
jgi:signal transduction histidine kinase/PAS domain-containing protein